MPPILAPSLELRIRGSYELLSEHERRLADVILASPRRLATHRASELSADAGVSKATASRFFRRLGYASFDEVRAQVRSELDGGSPLHLNRKTPASNKIDRLVEAHLKNEVGNLVNTYRSLDLGALPLIAKKIARARRVVLLGYRHGYVIASMFRRTLTHVRANVELLPAPGDTLAEALCSLGGGDVAICIDLRRRMPQMYDAVQAMIAMKVPVLYISDVIAGRSARLATWVVRCQTNGALMFDSAAGAVGVCNLLCSLAARELAGGRAHLEEVERLHESMRELD
jgi:DNA-binding MurR/RpiR family transcriptional regulator